MAALDGVSSARRVVPFTSLGLALTPFFNISFATDSESSLGEHQPPRLCLGISLPPTLEPSVAFRCILSLTFLLLTLHRFAANVVVMDVGRIAWRLQLGSAFIPALPLAIGSFSSLFLLVPRHVSS